MRTSSEETEERELHPLARLPDEWATWLGARGERAFRAKEIFRWFHQKGTLDPRGMTSVPREVREIIAGDFGALASVDTVSRATDGTRKLLVRFADGAPVETVLIPRFISSAKRAARDAIEVGALEDDIDEDDDDSDLETPNSSPLLRVTQCISTQVGCAMGCVFCASGVAGLKRQMTPQEIVSQIVLGRAELEEGERVTNVVYMGMGEPLHNYEATERSLKLLTHKEGLNLSTRRVTVSTSGLIPEIDRLGEAFGGQIGLAISLHAADDETRSSLMPINKKYPLKELMACLRRYPLPKRRRITIEYTLVAGKNDHESEAKKLVKVLRGLPVKVNLIPMNPISASSLTAPDFGGVIRFQDILVREGYACFVRRQRGDDVAAACGQLALFGAKPKVRGFKKPE